MPVADAISEAKKRLKKNKDLLPRKLEKKGS